MESRGNQGHRSICDAFNFFNEPKCFGRQLVKTAGVLILVRNVIDKGQCYVCGSVEKNRLLEKFPVEFADSSGLVRSRGSLRRLNLL